MGIVFAEKYEIVKKLAQGGMAQVYLATQKGYDGFEKVVVIKRILPHLAQSQEFVQMFLDEARTAADLRHANVVNIYEVGEAEGTYFMAMEFLHGRDIRDIQRKSAKNSENIPLPVILEILRQCALGLHYAHSKTDLKGRSLNIVHRDISPHNLIVTFEGTSKVVDFGIAKAESQTQQTASGVLKGKYSYMSPEQAAGKPLTALSDQYALGIVAWEAILMKRLFRRDNEIMTLHAILQNEVPSISSIRSDFPADLEHIVLKMLSPNAEDRFSSCQEVALAIEDFLVSERMPHSSVRVSQYLNSLFEDELDEEDKTGELVLGNSSIQSGAPLDDLGDTVAATEGESQSESSEIENSTTNVDGQTDKRKVRQDISTKVDSGFEKYDDDLPTEHEDRRVESDSFEGTDITKSHAGPGPLSIAPPKERTHGPKIAAGLFMVSMLSFLIFTALYFLGSGGPQKSQNPVEPPVSTPKQGEMPIVKKAPDEVVKDASNTQHWLLVTSEPKGAAVRYQGKDLGATPLKIPIAPSLFPFHLESYLPEFGLLKSECFAKPDEEKLEFPCVINFKKKAQTDSVKKPAQQRTPKEKNSSKIPAQTRPKLELIK